MHLKILILMLIIGVTLDYLFTVLVGAVMRNVIIQAGDPFVI
jgi:hypothetical protein